MRLDHLLSKEKIIVSLFCRWVGCWLVPGWWQVFRHCGVSGEAPGGGGFCFQVKASPARGFMRVWGISETKQIGEGLSAGWL